MQQDPVAALQQQQQHDTGAALLAALGMGALHCEVESATTGNGSLALHFFAACSF
jgi:hypothetical protein